LSSITFRTYPKVDAFGRLKLPIREIVGVPTLRLNPIGVVDETFCETADLRISKFEVQILEPPKHHRPKQAKGAR